MKRNNSEKTILLWKNKHLHKKLKDKGVSYISGKNIGSVKLKILKEKFKELYDTDFDEYYDKVIEAKKNRKNIKLVDNGYVYFFVNYEYGFCKIGYSLNPTERLNAVQTGCPFHLSIAGFIPGDLRLEIKMHKIYSRYNTNGEWFKIEGHLKTYLNITFPQNYDCL